MLKRVPVRKIMLPNLTQLAVARDARREATTWRHPPARSDQHDEPAATLSQPLTGSPPRKFYGERECAQTVGGR